MISKPDIALREATTEQIIDRLILDMLQRFHSGGRNADLDARIETAWLALRGVPFLARSVTPTYLRGYPGQGKTISYRVAAATVAQHIGLRFVANPADDFEPGGDELLFVVQELSGQVSAVDFGGIPNVQAFSTPAGDSQSFMTKLANKRLAALQYAGAAVLLLDDFSNASPNIRNVALSILTENRFQGLELGNTLVGATGNLGTSDGTNVSATSNAIVTRVANFLVVDSLTNWVERTQLEFADAVGDVGVAGFLRRYPDCFHMPKRSRNGVPYPCPRSWSLFVPKLREILFAYQQQRAANPNVPFPFDELEFEAAGFLGLEVANKLASYYLSYMQLSDPLAANLVAAGRWSDADQETFRKQYARGYAASAQQFGYQFMTALADYAAKAFLADIEERGSWPRVARALALGLYGERIDHALICYGAHYFALRIILLADGTGVDGACIGRLDDKGRPDLDEDFTRMLATVMAEQPVAGELVGNSEGDAGGGRRRRLLDETFCEVVSNFRGYVG
ncbi:MAG: hypothetical protein AAF529_05225 [Pseudomonadota bacterium]